ncbi:MAG: hypothetical protein DBX65_06335 [Oscillospiraceae bacterium]|nr:MAG: hypothetical protein DBX65_06335 [Oscillospiraceae bacterium]
MNKRKTKIIAVAAMVLICASAMGACKTSGAGASVAYGEVSEYACSAEIPFDKNNPATWFCAAQNGGIGEDQAEKLEVGMTFTEAVALLGRPQRDIGSGSMLAEWDMQSGKVLTVCFRPSGTDADATISYRILIRG